MADTDTEVKGASDGMDMKMVRTELKAYDSYNVSPLAIDRLDDDKLAADYKLLVDAGSIAAEGESLEDQDKKQKEYEREQLGLEESAPEPAPEPVAESQTAKKTATKKE